jgi:polar amino acid transport system substrate-binding protein
LKKLAFLLAIISVCSAIYLSAQTEQSLTLTSLEWPPYTSQTLKDLGASAIVATAAFKAMGYTLNIVFYPWDRAVKLAKTDPSIAGYFPEYYSSDNASAFIYSDPMGAGPLGFVERKDSPVKWSTLDDLKSVTIGVVEGYFNTEKFDAMVAAKELKVDAAPDDATNILKVAKKRFPIAVIDQNVLHYLLKNDKTSQAYQDTLQFNSKILERKMLFVCFKKGPDGEKYSKILDAGLKKINVDKLMEDYFSSVLGH